jgi:hypothetical protein
MLFSFVKKILWFILIMFILEIIGSLHIPGISAFFSGGPGGYVAVSAMAVWFAGGSIISIVAAGVITYAYGLLQSFLVMNYSIGIGPWSYLILFTFICIPIFIIEYIRTKDGKISRDITLKTLGWLFGLSILNFALILLFAFVFIFSPLFSH